MIALVALSILIALNAEDYSGLELLGEFIAFLVGIALIASLCVIVSNNIAANSTAAKMSVERESLVYQAQMNLYDNDNDIGKKETVDQITEWNATLAKNKKLQRDVWVGCFVPNIYDQFEPIPLDIIGG
jgi:hypothetical protein